MPRRNQGPKLRWLEKRKCFYVVWTESGRSRERSTGTDNRERAEAALADFIQTRRKRDGLRDVSEILVTEILADYASEIGPRTHAPWRIGYAVAPLAVFFIGKSVGNITKESCRQYAQWRNRSDGTIRRELGVLRAAIHHGYREGRLSRLVPIALPDAPDPKSRWLTREEAARLLRAALSSKKARSYLPLFILIGLRTGKRKEAMLSLRWPQVDIQNQRIDWNPPGRARTKKQRPKNPIPRRLFPHLLRAKLRGSDTGHVLNNDGRAIKDIKKSFATACKRADLEGVTPHTLRHTCATWLMQQGIDKWQVCGFLGMSMEMLERTYGHHHPDFQIDAANAF